MLKALTRLLIALKLDRLLQRPRHLASAYISSIKSPLTHYALVTWDNVYVSYSSVFSYLRAFAHTVFLSVWDSLPLPSSWMPHMLYKFSVAGLHTFQVSAEKSLPPEGLLRPTTKEKVLCPLRVPQHSALSHHCVPVHILEGQKNISNTIPLWKSTVFGQINTIISYAE